MYFGILSAVQVTWYTVTMAIVLGVVGVVIGILKVSGKQIQQRKHIWKCPGCGKQMLSSFEELRDGGCCTWCDDCDRPMEFIR